MLRSSSTIPTQQNSPTLPVSVSITSTSAPSTSALSPANVSGSGSAGAMSPAAAVVNAARLQFLKQRKLELDKILIDKNSLLQQLCRQESQITGIPISSSVDSNETTSPSATNTLRRKIGTSFKLPENLLNNNNKEDDVSKLLLSKQIQHQISEASLKMANDLTQTKVSRNLLGK